MRSRLVPQAIESHPTGIMDRKTDDSKIGARANFQLGAARLSSATSKNIDEFVSKSACGFHFNN
jgi:hypothetical protein